MERGKQGFFHRLRRGKFIAEVAGKLPLWECLKFLSILIAIDLGFRTDRQ